MPPAGVMSTGGIITWEVPMEKTPEKDEDFKPLSESDIDAQQRADQANNDQLREQDKADRETEDQ